MGSIVFQMDVQNQKAKLPPTNEVCEGYVFTPVCQSFCSRGEYLGRYTPGQVHPFPLTGTPHWQKHSPLGRYPPGQVNPPLQVHPLGRYPPGSVCWDTVNKRAVRILLECILVKISFLWLS